MELAKMTSNNQVTVPKSVRDRLGLQGGDYIAFIEENGQITFAKATVTIERNIEGMGENGT